jgi:hypothetical protein
MVILCVCVASAGLLAVSAVCACIVGARCERPLPDDIVAVRAPVALEASPDFQPIR